MKKKMFLTVLVILVSTFLFQVNAEAQCTLKNVNPEIVSATWIPVSETLNIFVEGQAKCPDLSHSKIIPGPSEIFPPVEFIVQVCEGTCDVIAPYRIIAHFPGNKTKPNFITIITPEGNKNIKVETILHELGKGAAVPKCFSEKLLPNEAVGIAPGSYDITLAYTNAVEQLKNKYKKLNVVVEEIGTIKGNTVMFYTYVKVKNIIK